MITVRNAYKEDYPDSPADLTRLLQNLNLATDMGFLNLAGLLLFAEQPDRFMPQFTFKAIRRPDPLPAGCQLPSAPETFTAVSRLNIKGQSAVGESALCPGCNGLERNRVVQSCFWSAALGSRKHLEEYDLAKHARGAHATMPIFDIWVEK